MTFSSTDQPPEDRRLLREVAEPRPRPLVHRGAGEVLPVEDDLARVGPDEAGQA